MLAGLETPDSGEVALRKGVRMVYVAQDPSFPPGTTVGAVLEAAAHERTAARRQTDQLDDEHAARTAGGSGETK